MIGDVLSGAGSISNTEMEQKVRQVYADFNAHRKAHEARLADEQDLKEIENKIKKHKR